MAAASSSRRTACSRVRPTRSRTVPEERGTRRGRWRDPRVRRCCPWPPDFTDETPSAVYRAAIGTTRRRRFDVGANTWPHDAILEIGTVFGPSLGPCSGYSTPSRALFHGLTLSESVPSAHLLPRFALDRQRSDGDLAERGENVAAIRLERLLRAVRHQVDIELIDPDRLQPPGFAMACSALPSTQKRSQISSVTNSPCFAPTRECSL